MREHILTGEDRRHQIGHIRREVEAEFFGGASRLAIERAVVYDGATMRGAGIGGLRKGMNGAGGQLDREGFNVGRRGQRKAEGAGIEHALALALADGFRVRAKQSNEGEIEHDVGTLARAERLGKVDESGNEVGRQGVGGVRAKAESGAAAGARGGRDGRAGESE